jgi:hypothetical protein
MVRPRPSDLLLAGILLGCAPALRAAAAVAAPDAAFVEEAVGAYISAGPRPALDEDIWTLAASPLLDFRVHPASLGRLWVQEAAFAAGENGLWRQAREEAAGSGETPQEALARLVTEVARGDGRVLLRTAARLYAAVEPEASPSRLRLFDLEAGALDAAPPAPLSVRHRSFLPEGETDSLLLAWPPDGGDGAAVVRYVDGELPPDVVFFGAGDRRAIPLSGVARIDFLVAGSAPGALGLQAPVECVHDAALPFSRLQARAWAGAARPRLTWSTASHAGLSGWAVFREEVLADGRIARSGPQMVPSSEAALESFGYAFVDTTALPETFYRYTVWAVTDEGLLARAFSATLETSRARRD